MLKNCGRLGLSQKCELHFLKSGLDSSEYVHMVTLANSRMQGDGEVTALR